MLSLFGVHTTPQGRRLCFKKERLFPFSSVRSLFGVHHAPGRKGCVRTPLFPPLSFAFVHSAECYFCAPPQRMQTTVASHFDVSPWGGNGEARGTLGRSYALCSTPIPRAEREKARHIWNVVYQSPFATQEYASRDPNGRNTAGVFRCTHPHSSRGL